MIGSTLLLGAAAPSTLLNGLRGFWNLEGTTNDATGLSPAGTLVGSGTWGPDYYQSAALSYINLGDTAQLKPTTAITVAGWFYFTGAQNPNQRSIADWHQNGGYDRWILGYVPDGTNVFGHMFGTNRTLGAIGTTIPTNTWTSLALTWTQSGAGPFISYRNASVVESSTGFTGTLNAGWPPSGFPVCVGAQYNSGGSVVGRIRRFGIWERVLTPAEITEFHNAGSGKSHPF